jgi:hypothetical protein
MYLIIAPKPKRFEPMGTSPQHRTPVRNRRVRIATKASRLFRPLPYGRAMKNVFLLVLFAVSSAWGAEAVKIPLTPDRWTISGPAEFVQHNGFDAIELKPGDFAKKIKSGQAVLKDFTFRDGTIEYDVDATTSMGAGFAFRRRDEDTYGLFYLRPRPKCEEAVDCIQYAPQTHGVLLWDVFPQYQKPAPLHQGEWNHIKLVVSGQRMNVFINGTKQPSLKVSSLEGDSMDGGLALQGPGIFANLTVTPGATEGLAKTAEKDPTADDRRFVRSWEIAPFSKLEADHSLSISELPSSWKPLAAERGGLLNVSRQYGLPYKHEGRGVVWLRTTIRSNADQKKHAAIGWSREIWVFVNGQPVFADKNLYQPPSARKTPDGRLSLENGSLELPLKAGDNEVDVALADDFYGWGLILRLDDLKGVSLARHK